MKLRDKVAIVTGGANGIGLAIVQRFVTEGARVMIADIESPPDEIVGDSVVAARCDVGQSEYVESTIQQTRDRFGHIDILVNNAGRTGGCGTFLDVTLADWKRYIATNLTGVFLFGQAVARVMVEDGIAGSIINIGSANSFVAELGASPYVASKGGVLMLTKAMAVDLAEHGIRANMIAPGPIRVDHNAALFDSESMRAGFVKSVPLGGQPGSGDDIAGAAVYFASDDSRFATGASLVIDGGATAIFRHD